MDKAKRPKLEAKGWKVGTVEEFLVQEQGERDKEEGQSGGAVARSKRRKTVVERNRQETSRGEKIRTITKSVLASNIPTINQDGRTIEEIEKWFNEDADAPVVVLSYPKDAKMGEYGPVQVSINAHGVERELRKRGMDENHPDWESAYQTTTKAFQGLIQHLMELHQDETHG